MSDIADFFAKLLDTADWPPRWHCGKWSDFHGWLYIISDLLIWSAYFAIPLVILKYASQRKDSSFIKLYFLFAAFILACGITHFLDAVMFWYPVYRLSALARAITAIISWTAVFSLFKILPKALAKRSSQALEDEIKMRVQAEEALKVKIEQLNKAELVGKFGHFEWDVLGNKYNWSVGMCALFELDKQDGIVTYEDYLLYIPEGQRKDLKLKTDTAIATNNYAPRYQEIITKNGERRILYLQGNTVLNEAGKVATIVGTAQDVTETQRNKEMLEDSRKLFESAFEHSPLGIALVSLNGKLIDANQAVGTITGYSKNELAQTNFFELTHPEDMERSKAHMQLLLRKEKQKLQSEKRLLTREGTAVWTLFSKSIVWNETSPSFFIFQIADLSNHRKIFLELEEKNNELENANRNLQYHVNQMTEFNRIVGHNLKGPAGSLINMADFIESSEDTEEKLFLLSNVKQTSQLIIRTLEDLKEFIEVKLNARENTPCRFDESLERALKLLGSEINKRKPVIKVTLDCESVKFPKLYLDSIMFNLLSNALKYQPKDGTPIINIRSYQTDYAIYLSITDNGIGIDIDKHKDDIFKYKRIFHKGYDSYGLGLFLTKTQIEAHGGKIVVVSEPGKGARFLITFLK